MRYGTSMPRIANMRYARPETAPQHAIYRILNTQASRVTVRHVLVRHPDAATMALAAVLRSLLEWQRLFYVADTPVH